MYLLPAILLSLGVGSDTAADQSKVDNEQTVQIFLLERQYLEGVTRAEGRAVGCGEGSLLYPRRTPFFRFSKADVEKCTIKKEVANVLTKSWRYRVDVKLTEAAEVEMMRRFRAVKSTVWWTISVDGKLRQASNTFHQSWTKLPELRVKTFSNKKEAESFRQLLTR